MNNSVAKLRVFLIGVVCMLTLIAVAGRCPAATYYVALDGDNSNPGTESRPWRTVNYGCRRVKAGDTLIIKPGDYGPVNNIRFTYDGTRSAPIIVKAQEPGTVIFRDGTKGFDLTNTHHVIIEGIKFLRYTTGAAIGIGDPASYIKVRKCIFEDNNGNGIVIWGHSGNLSLTHHFEFYENQFIDTSGVPADQDYGISMNYGKYAYVHNNYVYGIHHQAISFKRKFWYGISENNVFEGFKYTAQYIGQNLNTGSEDNRSRYIIVQGNVFRPARNYRAKTPIWCANVEYAVIRNNYMEGLESVDGGWGAGIHLSDSESGYQPGNPTHVLIYKNIMRRIGGTTNNPSIRALAKCTDVRIFNNTFAYCKRSIGSETPETLHFVNNIFYRYEQMVYEPHIENFIFEHNCIYPDWSGKGPTDFSADPRMLGPFTPMVLKGLNPHFEPDPRIDACKLKDDSPCIDAGKFLTTTVGSGSGKVITVKDAGWFTAGFNADVPDKEWFSGGFNEPQGSIIRVGDDGPLRVVSVNYANNTITVDKSISWGNGEGVSLYFVGSKPDVGALEHGSKVVARHIFYNNSAFDGNDPAANVADDGAIAPDKTALLPGQTATFANYTSYSRGINGIMIDIAGLPGTPTAADFEFKVGNDNNPSNWAAGPAPSSITVRRGAGVNGSDRITIIWADGAIKKQWLQVTVKPTVATGLTEPDVFYFGNAIGETGNSTTDARVTPTDEIGARNNPHTIGGPTGPAGIDDVYDFNRDRKVGPTDEIIARNNGTNSMTALKLITVP